MAGQNARRVTRARDQRTQRIVPSPVAGEAGGSFCVRVGALRVLRVAKAGERRSERLVIARSKCCKLQDQSSEGVR